ncbi:MAG: hypothetical protein R6X16_07455 [Anaerolineae bacterium]
MLEDDPEDVYGIQLVGESYEKEGAVEQAIQQYEAALQIDSRATSTLAQSYFYQRLDVIYNRVKRYSDCVRVCQQYADRQPDYWDAWNRLRRAARNTGDVELSQRAAENARKLRESFEMCAARNKARSEWWGALYVARLAELGYGPDGHKALGGTAQAPGTESSPPDYDASDDEWGTWVRESTDSDEIDAQQQAILDATAQLLSKEEQHAGDGADD